MSEQKKVDIYKFTEIYFVYFGNKDIYCIFKSCSKMPISFPTRCFYFTNLSLFAQKILMFFIKFVLKSKHACKKVSTIRLSVTY
jgi:hypothetical protein